MREKREATTIGDGAFGGSAVLSLRRYVDPNPIPMSRLRLEIIARIAIVSIVGIVALSACAQATTASPASSQNETVVDAPGGGGDPGSGTLRYRNDVQARSGTMDVPVDSAWARVQHVYVALKIPVTVLDSARRVIGAQNASVHDRLAGDRMSRWLSCGLTAFGQSRADSYSIYLTVLSQVSPQGTGSVVHSIVNGTAQPTDGATNRVQCSSTGALEKRLQDALGAQ